MLIVDSLSKSFEVHHGGVLSVTPFQGLSFSVETGEMLSLSGPSGIGKSSVLKCVYRTYLPTSGAVWFQTGGSGTVNLAEAPERQIAGLRKREIGYVSQFLKVIPRVPALDIVADRLLALDCPKEEAFERAGETLERLRIPKPLWTAYPATFSGGEQQRINLARALVAPPRLLILDEPTASLDRESKRRVLGMLRELKSKGTSMLGVFHDTETMEEIADRVLVLRSAN